MSAGLFLGRAMAAWSDGESIGGGEVSTDGPASSDAALAAMARDRGPVRVAVSPALLTTVLHSGRPASHGAVPAALGEGLAVEHELPGGHRIRASIDETRVTALVDAFREAGASIAGITLAEFAWAEAVRACIGPGRALVLVGLEENAELRIVAAENGAPVGWRRFRADATDETIREGLASLAPDPRGTPVATLGAEALRGRIGTLAVDGGFDVRGSGTRLEELGFDPALVAAEYAGTGPRFVPAAVAAVARRRLRRRAALAAVAALLLVAVAGVLDILDLRREAGAIEAARASHAAEVAAALDAQIRLDAQVDAIVSLEALRAETPRWTVLLGTIADALPRTAHVTGFRATADSVYLDVQGSDVADAVESLRPIPWWTGLRTASAVQTEVAEDGSVIERLTVAAHPTWALLNERPGDRP